MVGIAGILSPLPSAPAKEAIQPSANVRVRLESMVAHLTELVTTLPSARTLAELRRLLEHAAPEYLHIRNEVGRLFIDGMSLEEFSQFSLHACDEMLNAIQSDCKVLSAGEKETLEDVVNSDREILSAVLRDTPESPGIIADIVLECAHAILRLDMCLLAVMLVLEGGIVRWNASAIGLLTRAAREYVSQVEDTFLLHDAELTHRMATRKSQTLALDEVKRRVGICN